MKVRIEAPTDESRRERVEQQMFARLDAVRAALEVPASEARRDRVERDVFDHLSAMRSIEVADSIALRPRTRRWPYVAFAGAALAAVAIVVITTRSGDSALPTHKPVITHHLIPPGGGPSRWTSSDAIVEAFADTSVEERIDHEGVTLTLTRGKVDCDVEPRPGRAPFRVITNGVTVEVIGTRFMVQRTATGVRVDVARGKVRVRSPSGDVLLTTGDAWSSEPSVITAQAQPPPPPPAVDEDLIDLSGSAIEKPRPISGKEAFEQATRLEKRDLAASARMYRVAASGTDGYAALSLYSLAELERRRGASASALRAIDEYLRRFPRGANIEELVWLRVDIFRAAKRTTEMNDAARDYVRRFPGGTYAKPAQGLIRSR